MKVLVLGAGRCGTLIAETLAASGSYEVTLADINENAAARDLAGVPFVRCDGSRREEVDRLLPAFDAVVAATPSHVCRFVAAAASAAGVAYLDLVDLPEISAAHATGTMIPACGFSPGLVNNLAVRLAAGVAGPFDMTVRVGALPLRATNRLGYGLTWNIDDLIEEYTNHGAAIRGGKPASIAPLQEHEALVLDGMNYEAFTTGAATASLAAYLQGRAENFTLKTIRYAGHLDLIGFLLDDLGLARRKDLLKTVLQNGLPEVTQDELVLFITVRSGEMGWRKEVSDFRRITHGLSSAGRNVGALQRTSAGHVCAMLDLLRIGDIQSGGLVRHDDVPTDVLLRNRFVAELGL